MHVVAAPRRAGAPARSSARRSIAGTFVPSVLARLAAPRLDARLAAGEDPASDPALACRSRRLVSDRSRRRLACGLERSWSPPGDAVLSAAIPVDGDAVALARPALQQLASALRSRADVDPRGVAIARILLTEPCSALYHPAYPEQLYELARAALLALEP
jgi:hypothetical protein